VTSELNPVSYNEKLEELHRQALTIFQEALNNCSIETAFDRRLRFRGQVLERLLPGGSGPHQIDLAAYKRIFILAIGKAAGPMLETLLKRLPRRKGVRGICCSNQLPRSRNWRIRYFCGGHPLPNEESVQGARAALAMLRKARKDTLVIFLISGGGSAIFDLPLDPSITLEEMIAFHETLLSCGAPITEINTLRKHFSAVKGGRLALAAPEAAKLSILLPDVPLHSLDALSSGPTTPDHSTVQVVRTIIEKYSLAGKFPPAVRRFFEREDLPESPGTKGWKRLARLPWAEAKARPVTAYARTATAAATLSAEEPAFRDSTYEVLLSSHDLIENARALAEAAGFKTVIDNSCDDWDYAEAARYLLERFDELRKGQKRFCLLSAGEVTVTLPPHPGSGGRNQQFVLSCVEKLASHPGEALTVFSAGSDGVDGNTEAAGAIADPTTRARAIAFGFDPAKSLAEFDACPLFTALGDAVYIGPTGHNLRDLRIMLAEEA
jgi:hydroxypyruvate reductase